MLVELVQLDRRRREAAHQAPDAPHPLTGTRQAGGASPRQAGEASPRRRPVWTPALAVLLAAAVGWWLVPGTARARLLVVRSAPETTVVDLATGEATVRSAGGVPSPDGGVVVAAEPSGQGTALVAVDAATGAQRWRRQVPEEQSVRLVGWGGDTVVVGPVGEEAGLYLPQPRTTTELTVSRPGGSARTYRLEGNLEAEALSRDGASLFVVSYVPPEAPDRYQVRRLDLVTGEVVDVFTPDAHLQEEMGGTARTQVWAPDGNRLYTLYTLDEGGRSRVFVHVLALDELWAHCIEVPDGIGLVDPQATTLATAPDGRLLYVVDRATGRLAEVDTRQLNVTRTARFPRGSMPPDEVTATVTADGRVLVATGDIVHALAAGTLVREGSWPVSGIVAGLVEGERGEVVAVLRGRNAVVLDAASGEQLRTLRLPGTGSIEAVGGASTRVRGPQEVFKCAC